MLRTLLRIAALALLAEGSVTRRLLTSWLGPRTKGELAARSAAASELYLLRGGSTKTRKKKKAKKKVVVEEEEDEDEDEDEEAAAADGDFEEEEEAWSPEASGRRGGTRSGLQRGAETQPRLPPSKIELRAAGLRPRLWNSKECRERWMHALKTVSK